MKNFWKAFCNSLKEIVAEWLYAIKTTYKYLDVVINILNPYLFWFIMFTTNNEYNLFFIFPAILFLISLLSKKVNQQLSGKEDIPVYKKRFTKKENGVVLFQMSEIYEMVAYLNEVENSFERKGYYKNEKCN